MKRLAQALATTFIVTLAFAQTPPPPDFRQEFRLGEEAAKAGDLDGCIAHMTRALELNTKPINRPPTMYHLARAHALRKEPAKSVEWLGRLWDDKVESLMIWYVESDPAFESVRKTAEYAALLRKVDAMTVDIRPLSGNVFLIEGAGCNLLASIGPDGVLLVDSGYAPASKAIRKALDASGGKAIRYVINTHEHEDHVGGNATLGRGATVIAHEHVREALSKEQDFMAGVTVPPKTEAAMPSLVTSGPLTLSFNGETVKIAPLLSHTEGDIIVWFKTANVLHMGDDYFPGATRFIYPGEHVDPFFSTLGPIIAALPDDAKVVSGHGPVVSGRDLREIYTKTEAIYTFAKDAKAAGKSVEALHKDAAAAGLPEDWAEFMYERTGK